MEAIERVEKTSWFFRTVVKKRVRMGYLFALFFVLLADPSILTMTQGFFITLAGAAIRTWASGIIVKNNELATVGPYAIVRNPLYVGSFVMGFGLSFMSGSRILITLFVIFFALVYSALVRMEEEYLHDRYGETFRQYCRRVPRFIPEPWRIKPSPARYDARRMFFKHREWQAWLGVLAGMAFLVTAHRLWTHHSLIGLLLKKLFAAAPPAAG